MAIDRDHIAALAMQVLIPGGWTPEETGMKAYAYADALLAARLVPPPKNVGPFMRPPPRPGPPPPLPKLPEGR